MKTNDIKLDKYKVFFNKGKEIGKAQALAEVEKMIDTELNNCDKYIPKEDNHNFNRNTILGVTKNTLLLLKQNLKTLKEKTKK